MTTHPTDALSRGPGKDAERLLEQRLFEFLCHKYIQRADARQRAMGLQYTEAETHDLAKVVATWVGSVTLHNAPIAGSQYLSLPTRRASDAALQIAVDALRKLHNARASSGNDSLSFACAVGGIAGALSDIEAIVGPGIVTGEAT